MEVCDARVGGADSTCECGDAVSPQREPVVGVCAACVVDADITREYVACGISAWKTVSCPLSITDAYSFANIDSLLKNITYDIGDDRDDLGK